MTPVDSVPYATAKAFERALVDRIARASVASPYSVAQLRRQFAYGRMLARVFLGQPEQWVLKGATGLLARIPGQARHSMDVDLFFDGEIDNAIVALRSAVETDLGDFFSFDVELGSVMTGATIGGVLRIVAYLGDKVFEAFRVDVVVTDTMTIEPDMTPPIEPFGMPGLRSVSYRTYPIPDQIADKYTAMAATYAGRPSTRFRDLVDLVLIATTQTVEARPLHVALTSEIRRRGIAAGEVLALPSGAWHDGYRRVARDVPGFQYLDADEALEIVRLLAGPVLAGMADGVWDPVGLRWT